MPKFLQPIKDPNSNGFFDKIGSFSDRYLSWSGRSLVWKKESYAWQYDNAGKISTPLDKAIKIIIGCISFGLLPCCALVVKSIYRNSLLNRVKKASNPGCKKVVLREGENKLDAASIENGNLHQKEGNGPKAVECFSKTANGDSPKALFKLGKHFQERNDDEKAKLWFKKSAELHHAKAMLRLGDYCVQKRDFDAAIAWFEKAAQKNNRNAMFSLGHLFRMRKPIDHDKVFLWFKKAAELGHKDAMAALGACFFDGKGTPKDIQAAKNWFLKAIALNSESAKYNLGALLLLDPNTKDYAEVVHFLKSGSQSPRGAINLIIAEQIQFPEKKCDLIEELSCHLKRDIPKDYIVKNEANHQIKIPCLDDQLSRSFSECLGVYYHEATRNNNPKAMLCLGVARLLLNENMEAKKWLQQAADLGDSKAVELLKDDRLTLKVNA